MADLLTLIAKGFRAGAGIVSARAENANARLAGRARANMETALTNQNVCHPDVGINPDLQAAEGWFNALLARARAIGPFADFHTVTPPIARVILMHNTSNRAIVAAGVAEWSVALRKRAWEENGEPIIIAVTGELNDGQHRLTAVVETGIPLRTLIVVGVSRQSRKTVDTGKKRTPGHVLGMSGVANATLAASALKLLLNFEAGLHLQTHRQAFEIELAHASHPAITEGSNHACKAARLFKQSLGLFTCLHYMMARVDAAKAGLFFEMLFTGIGFVDKDHPVARLRARLQSNMAAKGKLPAMEVAAIIIKAWNAFVEGRTIDALRWRTVGDAPESFPQVRA